MLSGSPTGRSRSAERDTQLILEALRRAERRVLDELRNGRSQSVDDPQEVNRTLESVGDRFETLNRRIAKLPEMLTQQRREVMQQFADQLRDLRQDLRAYTLMMGVAIVLIVLLLVVLLFFRPS
jgi:predicted nuclease with TOPRIM domain